MPHTKLILILSVAIAPLLVNGFVNAQIYSSPLLYWSFELLTWIVLPLGIFMASRHYCDLKLSDIGITQRIFEIKSITLVLFVSVILAPTIFLVYQLSHLYFEKIFIFEPIFEYETVIPQSGVLKFLVTFYFSLSAGIVEEFYRGLVYKLSRYYSRPDILFLILSPLFFCFAPLGKRLGKFKCYLHCGTLYGYCIFNNSQSYSSYYWTYLYRYVVV
ncbi:MAG: hypothetical protein KU38_00760 [Sulfurovum sp. FS08-3]|nr:MAG: hypothetical protein KU38_00760 [Sulfurovum sp. FS08-3]